MEVVSPAANALSGPNVTVHVPPSMTLVLHQFLDDWHYRSLCTTLAERWESKRTLSSALHLLRQHGVDLSQDEEEELLQLTDEELVDQLVQKVPTGNSEHFKVFFLQLQIVVETVTRLRKGLEDGRQDEVEAAMTDAESAGVLQYILRQTLVHAGQELQNAKQVYAGWKKDTEAKMARMLHYQREAMELKHLLKNIGALQRKRAFETLWGVAKDQDARMLKTTFAGWQMVIQSEKSEALMREEFEFKLQETEEKLQKFRVKQLANIHGVMAKRTNANDQQLMIDLFNVWVQDTKEQKMQKAHEEDRKKRERDMERLMAAQASTARQVMERMTGAQGLDLCKLCWTSWTEELAEERRHRHTENARLAEEARMKAMLESRKNQAGSVLHKLNRASDDIIISEVFFVWQQRIVEDKRLNAVASELKLLDEKTQGLFHRTLHSALFVMTRVVVNFDTTRLLRCFTSWTAASRMERLKKYYDGKIDNKRHQLQSVQNLFREFAGRLETGITKSPRDDSARGSTRDDGLRLPELGTSSAQGPGGNGRPPTAPLRRDSNSASQPALRKDRPQTAGGTPSQHSSTSLRPPPQPVRDEAPSERRSPSG